MFVEEEDLGSSLGHALQREYWRPVSKKRFQVSSKVCSRSDARPMVVIRVIRSYVKEGGGVEGRKCTGMWK